MQKLIKEIKQFWKVSYETDKIAFYLELVSVAFTITGSLLLTFGSPHPNMAHVFPVYIFGSATLAIASYRRKIIWTLVLASWFTTMNLIGNIRVFLL